MHSWLVSLLLLTLVQLQASYGQASENPFSISPLWNSTSSLSRQARFTIARDTLNTLAPSFNFQTFSSSKEEFRAGSKAASLTWVYILQDLFNNSTVYENLVQSNIQAFASFAPGFWRASHNMGRLTSDATLWGVVNYYAFKAYGDQSYLTNSISIWNETTPFVISGEQAAGGSSPNRNVTFAGSCSDFKGASTAGGVFWLADDPADTGINGESVGPYVALSAYLYEATNESIYMDAANLSASFIQTILYNGELISDNVHVKNSTCPVQQEPFTYNSGFAIEGLSVLAHATNNTDLQNFTNRLISFSINTPIWTNGLGIITEGSQGGNPIPFDDGFKAFFIRGLHTAWRLSDPSSDIAKLIAAFITVQFNALQQQTLGNNIYPGVWTSSTTSLDPYSQVIALHVLNPAFDIATDNSSPTTNSTSPSANAGNSSTASNRSRVNAGAIAGGAVGGYLFLSSIVGVVIWLRRRRRRHEADQQLLEKIEPFTEQPAHPLPRGSRPLRADKWAWLTTSGRRGETSVSGDQPPPSVVPPSSSGRSRAMAELTEAMVQLIEVLRIRSIGRDSKQ